MFSLAFNNKMQFLKTVCILVCTAMICCNTFITPIFAESINFNVANDDWAIINKGDKCYEKALSVLGITEEEAKNYSIFSVLTECDSSTTNVTSEPTPMTYIKFNEFTFYTSNVGSYWTCDGNQLKWGFTWYCTYGENIGQYLYVQLYQFEDTFVNDSGHRYCGNSYTSDWLAAVKGCDYRFKYYTAITADPYTLPYATVQMFAAMRTV